MKVHSSVLFFIASIQHVSAQDPGPCSLCIDGSDPPLLDNPVFDFGANESTCADFAAGAAAITVVDENTFLACRQLQVKNMYYVCKESNASHIPSSHETMIYSPNFNLMYHHIGRWLIQLWMRDTS